MPKRRRSSGGDGEALQYSVGRWTGTSKQCQAGRGCGRRSGTMRGCGRRSGARQAHTRQTWSDAICSAVHSVPVRSRSCVCVLLHIVALALCV